ncbi:MAG: C1 family peptidase [Bdellovibrionota bacterium]
MKSIASCLALVAVFAMSSASAAVDVSELNRELTGAKASWVARESAISRMSIDELKRITGLQQEGLYEDVDFGSPLETEFQGTLPAKWDWRDQDGANWVSPILDQGNCGSCVAFAAVATMETQMKIASGLANLPVRLSPQALHTCGGGSCAIGWWPGFAARYLQKTGVPDDACMPYESGVTGKNGSCSAICADAPKRRVRIAGFSRPTVLFGNVSKVKRALLKGPVMTAMLIFEDFAAYGGGVYRHRKGGLVSAHAVSVVGYDDAERAFIVRNSWGDKWGENGFFRIAYDDISGAGRMTWAFQMPSPQGVVALEAPPDDMYVTGSMPIEVRSTYTASAGRRMTIYDSKSNPLWGMICGTTCDDRLDVSRWTDGRYEIDIVALDASGRELGRSQRQSFYVVNRKPVLALGFAAVKGTDLSKPLSGRVEFDLTTKSSSVPMTSVEFHARRVGGDDLVRTANVVLSKMTLGWKTTAIPNGTYEIWFVGRMTTSSFDERIETVRRTVTVRN